MRYVLSGLRAVIIITGTMLGTKEDPQPASLFDGKSLAGWSPEHTDRFTVRAGVIAQQGGAGWLRSEKIYKNFEFQAEFRTLKEGVESGLLFRASQQSASREPFWPEKGYQLQISDGEGNLMLFGHGIMPPRFDRKTESLKAAKKPPGEWQKLILKVRGSQMEAVLNGVVITTSGAIELQSGHLGLLGKNGPIEWRDLKIREYPDQ